MNKQINRLIRPVTVFAETCLWVAQPFAEQKTAQQLEFFTKDIDNTKALFVGRQTLGLVEGDSIK